MNFIKYFFFWWGVASFFGCILMWLLYLACVNDFIKGKESGYWV